MRSLFGRVPPAIQNRQDVMSDPVLFRAKSICQEDSWYLVFRLFKGVQSFDHWRIFPILDYWADTSDEPSSGNRIRYPLASPWRRSGITDQTSRARILARGERSS